MFWQIPSSMFLGSAAAITVGSMMIHLNLAPNTANTECVGTNCTLGGPYGTGILAVSIVSIVFNAIMFMTIFVTWWKMRRSGSSMRFFTAIMSLTTLSMMMAIAASGYNIWIQQNFGAEFASGNINCGAGDFADCTYLSGSDVEVWQGLNATALALSGLVMLGLFTMFAGSRWSKNGLNLPLLDASLNAASRTFGGVSRGVSGVTKSVSRKV